MGVMEGLVGAQAHVGAEARAGTEARVGAEARGGAHIPKVRGQGRAPLRRAY